MQSKSLAVHWVDKDGLDRSGNVKVLAGAEVFHLGQLCEAVNGLRGLPPHLPVVYSTLDGVVLAPALVLLDDDAVEVSVATAAVINQRSLEPVAFPLAQAVTQRRASGKVKKDGTAATPSPTFDKATLEAGVWLATLEPLATSRHLKGA